MARRSLRLQTLAAGRESSRKEELSCWLGGAVDELLLTRQESIQLQHLMRARLPQLAAILRQIPEEAVSPCDGAAWAEGYQRAIRELLKDHRTSKWFGQPVNLQKYPDYTTKIAPNRPIDLQVVLDSLASSAYAGPEACDADLAMIWDNAARYNKPDSAVRLTAEKAAAQLADLLGKGRRAASAPKQEQPAPLPPPQARRKPAPRPAKVRSTPAKAKRGSPLDAGASTPLGPDSKRRKPYLLIYEDPITGEPRTPPTPELEALAAKCPIVEAQLIRKGFLKARVGGPARA